MSLESRPDPSRSQASLDRSLPGACPPGTQVGLHLSDSLTPSRESRSFSVEGAMNNPMPLIMCQLLAEVRSPTPSRRGAGGLTRAALGGVLPFTQP